MKWHPQRVIQVELAEDGWSAAMGGALELLARDAAGRPAGVVRSVTPVNNMMAFFQVGPETFHQVYGPPILYLQTTGDTVGWL